MILFKAIAVTVGWLIFSFFVGACIFVLMWEEEDEKYQKELLKTDGFFYLCMGMIIMSIVVNFLFLRRIG